MMSINKNSKGMYPYRRIPPVTDNRNSSFSIIFWPFKGIIHKNTIVHVIHNGLALRPNDFLNIRVPAHKGTQLRLQ
jgi:hypothetical protein